MLQICVFIEVLLRITIFRKYNNHPEVAGLHNLALPYDKIVIKPPATHWFCFQQFLGNDCCFTDRIKVSWDSWLNCFSFQVMPWKLEGFYQSLFIKHRQKNKWNGNTKVALMYIMKLGKCYPDLLCFEQFYEQKTL